ncbi:MAG: helix-turn-helix domain-containing protein [Alphaproteobacteria bacterium]
MADKSQAPGFPEILHRSRTLAGLTQKDLAAQAQVPYAQVRRLEGGDTSPTAEIEAKLLRAILARVIETAGPSDGDRGLLELVRLYRQLPTEGRSALREFLRATT